MILMRANGQWFECAGVDHDEAVVHAWCGAKMPHPDDFEKLHPSSTRWHGSFPLDATQIQFFAAVSWRGIVVEPLMWSHTSPKPKLHCRISGDAVREATTVDGLAPSASLEERTARLEHEGWKPNIPDGWTRWCHVDELDKQPGPPPGIRA